MNNGIFHLQCIICDVQLKHTQVALDDVIYNSYRCYNTVNSLPQTFHHIAISRLSILSICYNKFISLCIQCVVIKAIIANLTIQNVLS